MSPELEAALEPIGWPVVKARAPNEASQLAFQLETLGARFGQTPAASKLRLKQAQLAMKGLRDFYDWSSSLSEHERSFLSPRYMVDGEPAPDFLEDLRELISCTRPSLANMERWLRHEKRGQGKRNESARAVADALVRINVMGTGQRAKPSRDDTEEPNNEFSRVARRVFSMLAIGVGWYKPCLDARNALTPREFDRLQWATSPCPVRRWQEQQKLRDFFLEI
ncbi:hypothetical protein HKCCSP123_00835 [Rhodobacterales bacterium HKCCSP123]|nr:hypothetical protein [Rhodobacterales bacterium HKCCSP123]